MGSNVRDIQRASVKPRSARTQADKTWRDTQNDLEDERAKARRAVEGGTPWALIAWLGVPVLFLLWGGWAGLIAGVFVGSVVAIAVRNWMERAVRRVDDKIDTHLAELQHLG